MPGHYDPSTDPKQFSNFFRYLADVVATGSAPSGDVSDLNLTTKPNAADVRLNAIIRSTDNLGLIKLAFYVQLADGGDLADVWILERTTDWLAVNVIHKLTGLYAGKYKIIVSARNAAGGAGNFSVYLAVENSQLQVANLV